MKLLSILAVWVVSTTSPSFAFAAPKSKKSESISSSQSAPDHGGRNLDRVGVGLTTLGSSTLGSLTSLSTWLEVSSTSSIQATFGIASTSPFQFGIGGLYRHTVSGGAQNGFHVGGGLLMGTIGTTAAAALGGGSSTAFFVNIAPLGGFHFTLPGLSSVMASVDGGPVLNITDGDADFGIGGLSSALGLSLHYFF